MVSMYTLRNSHSHRHFPLHDDDDGKDDDNNDEDDDDSHNISKATINGAREEAKWGKEPGCSSKGPGFIFCHPHGDPKSYVYPDSGH